MAFTSLENFHLMVPSCLKSVQTDYETPGFKGFLRNSSIAPNPAIYLKQCPENVVREKTIFAKSARSY